MISTEKSKRLPIARFVFCVLLILLFLHDPAVSSRHMGRGLSLCAETLIPTLFPFMVISEILVRADIASYASPLFGKPMRYLFGVSGSGAAALILGILCGFPVGGKTAAALYERGDISKHDAERLMPFCNLPSAPFMIFAVGEKMFGSRRLGVFLYINTLAVTLACGMILKLLRRDSVCDHLPTARDNRGSNTSLIRIFTDSVTSAAGAIINVCAYVCFFTCAVGCLASLFADGNSAFCAILFSFFELTSGAAACSSAEPRVLGIIFVSAAAGWSGLSVFFQIFSLSRTKRGDISMKPYLAAKALSALFCGISSALAVYFFPSLIPKNMPGADAVLNMSYFPTHFISALNIIFMLSLVIYLYKELDIRHKI